MEQTLHLPGHTGLSIAVVALLSIAGLLLYVARVRGAAGRRDQILLTVLRMIAVGGVVIAWLQPSWRTSEVVRRQSVVPVLVDESLSMTTRGASGLTRAQAVAAFFVQHRGDFERLEDAHDVQYFAYSDTVRPVTRQELESPLEALGGRTDVLHALETVVDQLRASHWGGILVVTDGLDNGPSLAARAGGAVPSPGDFARIESLPCPVHVLVPPDGPAPRDIALDRLSGLEYVLQRDLAEVVARVRTRDLPDTPITVRLLEGDQVLDERTVFTQGGRLEVPLRFLPRSPGRRVLELEATLLPDEATSSNNRRSAVARVLRDRIRVLHVSGHASWDERFLREYLGRRRDIELVSFHTLRTADAVTTDDDEQTTLIAFPAEELFIHRIEGFDLVILQDYELPDMDRARFAAGVVRYVEQGGALLFISGGNSLGARGPWPEDLASVLPVHPLKAPMRGMIEGRFPVELTEDGRRSPLLGRLKQELGAEPPPLPALTPVGGVARDATVLLQASTQPDRPAHPLLVVAARGQGRVATLLTDSLWRWSFDTGAKVGYRQVLDGTLAFLTRDPSGDLLQVAATRPRLTPGALQEVRVRAPTGVPAIRVEVRQSGGDLDKPVHAEDITPDESGTARTSFVAPRSGTFRVRAECAWGDLRLRAEDLFLVAPSDEELDGLTSLERTTLELASRTGGQTRSLASPELSSLPLKPEVVARVGLLTDKPLWDHPLILLLLLGVLALEWYAERKIGYT